MLSRIIIVALDLFIPHTKERSQHSKRIENKTEILNSHYFMALYWYERPEIFNKMVFIECNYEVADWLLGESIILFYVNTYI